MGRESQYERTTRETKIKVNVNLDGTGVSQIDAGSGFLDHMLTSLSTHSLIDIQLKAEGDLQHHIIEDVAISLGRVLLEALKETPEIIRFSSATVPMDCSLASCAVDLGGRPYHIIDLRLEAPSVEGTPSEDLTHFFESLATELRANIHLEVKYGKNDHHKAEAAFKALAICLRNAIKIDPNRVGVPSSKGEPR
ncbi:imidazoleglycerol-phosphate dehydratase HisB [Candidatus Bathyarchaeota archaeon]|nr:imidazoleglycerol-phosphate dehydratase HisB [Candidatus Bathyarchaeota archaeon]